jgi:hypothetical protein
MELFTAFPVFLKTAQCWDPISPWSWIEAMDGTEGLFRQGSDPGKEKGGGAFQNGEDQLTISLSPFLGKIHSHLTRIPATGAEIKIPAKTVVEIGCKLDWPKCIQKITRKE